MAKYIVLHIIYTTLSENTDPLISKIEYYSQYPLHYISYKVNAPHKSVGTAASGSLLQLLLVATPT